MNNFLLDNKTENEVENQNWKGKRKRKNIFDKVRNACFEVINENVSS
jgi:hypothetical protein